MNSPYDPPTSEIESFAPPPAQLPWVQYTRWTLNFCGVAYVLMGLVAAALRKIFATMGGQEDTMPLSLQVGLTLFIVVLCAGFGVVNFVAAWGLGQRRKWAWVTAVILGGIYAPSGCLPFGAVILYGMLKEDVRKAFIG